MHPRFVDAAVAGTSDPLDIKVDFVLLYKDYGDRSKVRKRVAFERSLLETGLILSTEIIYGYHFTKVNIPIKALYQYGELLKLRMPLKLDRTISPKTQSGVIVNRFLSYLNVKADMSTYTLKAEFKRDKLDMFDVDSPDFFNMCTRIFVVSYILDRAHYSIHNIGIMGLISEGVYDTAYPLHEGSIHDKYSTRYYLFKNWASFRKIFQRQPLDDIKNYFGTTVALFFAWQGFYIQMLIPISAIALVSYAVAYSLAPEDAFINELCASNYTMCPQCDVHCPYWKLDTACHLAKIAYGKDNFTTIPLSVIFIIWGVLHMCLWRRYRTTLTYNWGLANYHPSEEPSRPQYLLQTIKVKTVKLNIVTLQLEAHLPFWRKRFPIHLLSGFVMFIMMALYVSIYIAGNIYHSVVTIAMSHKGTDSQRDSVEMVFYTCNYTVFTLIYVLFKKGANILTNYEKHRTQTEHEGSLYLKYYLFEFVLFYSAIIYVAFFKSHFIGRPGAYNRFFGFRPVECIVGCEYEIVVVTGSFLLLKQIMFVSSVTLMPMLRLHRVRIVNMAWWKQARNKNEEVDLHNQMVEDSMLLDSKFLDVYYAYLHTTVEFGFITMFGICFPLVAVMVLCVNILNLRMCAYMYLKYYKRPIPRRSRNIGIWVSVNSVICRLAVITNSLLIALSPAFMSQVILWKAGKTDWMGTGLLAQMLSTFDSRDLEKGTEPDEGSPADICYYFDFRLPHDHKNKYQIKRLFWVVLVGRLVFVMGYHVIVYTIVNFLDMAIPSMPSLISDKIQMENYHINKAILKAKKLRWAE